MQFFSRVCCLCLVCVLHAVVGHNASAQLSQLVTRVPKTANALVIVNAQAVRSSPLAAGGNRSAAVIALPARVQWYLLAAEMDFEYLQPLWEVAVAYLPEKLAMKEVATHSGGRLDRLAGSQAVERPNDSYVVSYGPRVVGAMSPANRQNVIRWVRESKVKRKADLSPYLAQAVGAAEQGPAQIVIAFDLAGVLAPAEVSFALASSQALARADVDVEQAANIVAGVVGVRLEIELKDAPQARLWLAFEEDPSPLAKVAKPLLVEILTKRGAQIQTLPGWNVRSEQQAIVLEGQLSPGGLRRVLSLLSGPVGPWATASGGASLPKNTSPENVAAQSSRAYFQSVTGYLNDLFFDNVRPQSMQQISVWVERYARKIEDLDATHVDPDLKSFATDVVMSLREIGSVIERSQIRSDMREATMYDSGRSRYGRYGAYGWFEKSYVTRDRALIQTDEALRGLRGSEVIVEELHALTAQTRKTMTDRYGLEF